MCRRAWGHSLTDGVERAKYNKELLYVRAKESEPCHVTQDYRARMSDLPPNLCARNVN